MNPSGIQTVLRAAAAAGIADAELLSRFAATRDESAFELLVWRHAGLVQRVCVAILRDHHAAEDAAQAAFLVLARKANTFAGRGSVVGWLYRIARRIAVRAAKERARRRTIPADLDHLPDARPEPRAEADEVVELCREVDRLPERYRVPVLLCFFEGLTHAEAARRVGWPVGTVAGRLARAKDLLARRLAKKELVAVALAVPAGGFVGGTARAAVAFAAPPPSGTITGVDPSVVRLAEGALKAMTGFTWKLIAAAAVFGVTVSAVTAGVFGLARPVPPVEPPTVPVAAPVPEKREAGERAADARQRARSQNNLKYILVAIHNYHDANREFPRNITDKDGKPLLSWRVAILPYLEAEELYKQFKLDEPWDSAHNKKLLAKMPDVYRVGFEPKGETKTYYQGFAGPGALFDPDKKVTLLQITDGTSNTLAVVEAGPPVEWTKPADIPYDPKAPLPKLEGPFSNVLMAATADAAAYTFRRDIDAKNLRRLIEVADGEIVNPKDFSVALPLSAEDVKAAEKVLKENEKLIDDLAGKLKEQQKLLLEQIKKPNATDQDLDRLLRTRLQLGLMFGTLRWEIEGPPARPAPEKK